MFNDRLQLNRRRGWRGPGAGGLTGGRSWGVGLRIGTGRRQRATRGIYRSASWPSIGRPRVQWPIRPRSPLRPRPRRQSPRRPLLTLLYLTKAQRRPKPQKAQRLPRSVLLRINLRLRAGACCAPGLTVLPLCAGRGCESGGGNRRRRRGCQQRGCGSG